MVAKSLVFQVWWVNQVGIVLASDTTYIFLQRLGSRVSVPDSSNSHLDRRAFAIPTHKN